MPVLSRLALLACIALWSSAALHAAESRKPNIIVIIGDDMGYADIGVHGCKDIPTPHIDSLARHGVRCTSGYVSGPYCSPTRAGLLTGRYQTRFGHEFNPGPKASEAGLPLSQKTMADSFKAAGYRTALVGKWHLGSEPRFHPQKRGFDEFFGFLGGAHSYFQDTNLLRGTESIEEPEYLTDALAREAVAFIDRHRERPFFLYLAFNAVHAPMDAAEKYLKRFSNIADENRRKYAAMMSAMDDGVGAVLEKLRKTKLEEDTLVFFVSDNGGPPVNSSLNTPLNGRKATTWEGGIRVPWLVQWKGRLPAGKVYNEPVIQLDILPTSLAAAGISPPADTKFDGVNLLPHFEGKAESPPHTALFWRFGRQTAVRMGDWKLVEATGSEGKKLFNLRDDIGETKDLAAANPEKLRELQAAWDQWNKDNVPPAWGAPEKQKQKQKKNKAKNKNKAANPN